MKPVWATSWHSALKTVVNISKLFIKLLFFSDKVTKYAMCITILLSRHTVHTMGKIVKGVWVYLVGFMKFFEEKRKLIILMREISKKIKTTKDSDNKCFQLFRRILQNVNFFILKIEKSSKLRNIYMILKFI